MAGVRVAAGKLGKCLLATRAFAPGETALLELPLLLLIEGAAVSNDLLKLVANAMGASPGEALARRIAQVLDLWMRSGDSERTAWRGLFCTPDEVRTAAGMLPCYHHFRIGSPHQDAETTCLAASIFVTSRAAAAG